MGLFMGIATVCKVSQKETLEVLDRDLVSGLW